MMEDKRRDGCWIFMKITNMQGLQEEMDVFHDVELQIEVLNRRQCKNLSGNLRNGVRAIQSMTDGCYGADVFHQVEQEMLGIMKKARKLVEECFNIDDWSRVVIMQLNNKESFEELLLDFEYCFHTTCEIFCDSSPNRKDEIQDIEKSTTFYPASNDEVEQDQKAIFEQLSRQVNLCRIDNCKEHCMILRYSMERMRRLQKVVSGESNSIIFPSSYPSPEPTWPPESLGTGSYGNVWCTKWLGLDTATKVIEVGSREYEAIVWKEASILGGLNHPNIITFVCCGLFTKCDKHGTKRVFFQIVMELGDMSLSKYLEQQNSLAQEVVVDIMIQIASGMCYLHKRKVAHRDLKPNNVVLTSMGGSRLGHVHVKILDFGISKIEVKNSPEMPTNGGCFGTIGYMAPEAYSKRSSEVDAFKTDVFSFGMMCYEILSNKRPSTATKIGDYVKSILEDERPEVPDTYSESLRSLIHECWSSEPSNRPTFFDISKKLRKIKNDGMIKVARDVRVAKFSQESTTSNNGLSNVGEINIILSSSAQEDSNQMPHEVTKGLMEDRRSDGHGNLMEKANIQSLLKEVKIFHEVELQIEVLNSRQCKNLLVNLGNGLEAIQSMIGNCHRADVFHQVEQEMLGIMKRAMHMVEECRKVDDWCRVVALQLNNKESFRELLLDFENCFHIMCNIFCYAFPNCIVEIKDIEKFTTFYPATIDEVEQDQKAIFEQLSRQVDLCKIDNCEDQCILLRYLMERMKKLQEVASSELHNDISRDTYPSPTYGTTPKFLGLKNVYATQWLGLDTATKVIKVDSLDHEAMIWKETSILRELNHPNIIILFGCASKCDPHTKGSKTIEIVMERGEMSLSTFLEQQNSLVQEVVLDIMIQIASGMCYLHKRKVAHRDLKPNNVVLTSMGGSRLGHVHVKILDFGISKIEVKNSPEMPTNGGCFGTIGYMAPEAYSKRSSEVDAFKTDVFSFGMMCYEILSNKRPSTATKIGDYVKSILEDERPEVPDTYSESLRSLIHECWSSEPSNRPTFFDISKKLRKIKNDGMIKVARDVRVAKFSQESTTSNNGLSNVGEINIILSSSAQEDSNQMPHEVTKDLMEATERDGCGSLMKRGNIQGLLDEVKIFHDVELQIEVLNSRQCKNLLVNLGNGVKAIQSMIDGVHRLDVFHQVEQEMLGIMKRAMHMVEECRKVDDWCRVVALQLNNKESFRELLLDFENCFHTMCDIFCYAFPNRIVEIKDIEKFTTFYPATIDEVEQDQKAIFEQLSRQVDLCKIDNCKEHCILLRYLMKRMRRLQEVASGELHTIVILDTYSSPEYGMPPKLLGTGGLGNVYSTQWLGLDSATIVIEVDSPRLEASIWKEVSILGELNHPNIIIIFGCGLTCNYYRKESKVFEIVMERGDMMLSTFLERRQKPLAEEMVVDIMIQIASGMWYLHDMKISHNNLRLVNIILTSMGGSKLGHVHVKILDFGISKIEVKNPLELPTNGGPFCTIGNMVREAYSKRSLGLVDAFKIDVLSFGIMWYEILSNKKPSTATSIDDYVKSILENERPKIPDTYSKGLRSLIHECWSLEPSNRLTFLDISKRLRRIKNNAMINIASDVRMIEFFQEFEFEYSRDRGTMVMHKLHGLFVQPIYLLWQKGNTFVQWLSQMLSSSLSISTMSPSSAQDNSNITTSKQIPFEVTKETNKISKLVGLEGKILELEKLLHYLGILGIVGTGGIGKSTLAKALSDHISHQFDATCFVGNFTNGSCTIHVKYKLEDVEEPSQTKTFKEGHEFLKQLQKTRKILIILDSVGNAWQLERLLHNHTFQDVDGSELIAISRSWEALKRYVPIVGRVDMARLNEEQSKELFYIHAFVTNQPCLPLYLEILVGKVVKACDGIPLNLEVAGKYLYEEKISRIWEQTLQQLLRARQDKRSIDGRSIDGRNIDGSIDRSIDRSIDGKMWGLTFDD